MRLVMPFVINALGRTLLDALFVLVILARLTGHVCATATIILVGQLAWLVMQFVINALGRTPPAALLV